MRISGENTRLNKVEKNKKLKMDKWMAQLTTEKRVDDLINAKTKNIEIVGSRVYVYKVWTNVNFPLFRANKIRISEC